MKKVMSIQETCPECGSQVNYLVDDGKVIAELCTVCEWALQVHRAARRVTLNQMISGLSPVSQKILRG